MQIDNRTPNYGCGVSEDTKEIKTEIKTEPGEIANVNLGKRSLKMKIATIIYHNYTHKIHIVLASYPTLLYSRFKNFERSLKLINAAD